MRGKQKQGSQAQRTKQNAPLMIFLVCQSDPKRKIFQSENGERAHFTSQITGSDQSG
jgi:hypothetical protein